VLVEVVALLLAPPFAPFAVAPVASVLEVEFIAPDDELFKVLLVLVEAPTESVLAVDVLEP